MKAIVCEEPNKLQLMDVEPPTLKEGEALVRIRRVGICGTDLHAYRGRQPYFTYPRILGHELSGEIVELSTPSTTLKVGDKVTIIPYVTCNQCLACRSGRTNCCNNITVLGVHADGGLREQMAVPIKNLIQSNDISFDAAATIECLSIGAHAVARGQVEAGQFALVIGAGPIGLGVMKFLQLAGVHVIAMDINEERLTFCKNWAGASYTVNALYEPLAKIMEITDGNLVHAAFDATGNVKSMEGSFQYVAHSGKVIYVSLVKDNITFYDPDFHQKEMTLLSSRNAQPGDFQQVIDAIAAGHIDTDAFITHRTEYTTMIDHFDSWTDPATGVIKAMVEFND